MSKALSYHYYADKSGLLFDIIRTHLEHLLTMTAVPDGIRLHDPRVHLKRLAETLLEAYHRLTASVTSRSTSSSSCPKPQQAALKAMQRKLVDRFAMAIAPCLTPGLDQDALLKPLTMSLFGMLNWHHLWFREEGPMTRSGYAKLAAALVADGAWAQRDVPARTARPASTSVTPGRSR